MIQIRLAKRKLFNQKKNISDNGKDNINNSDDSDAGPSFKFKAADINSTDSEDITDLEKLQLDLYKAVQRTKHNTFRPLDDHRVILSTWKAFDYFRARPDEIRFTLLSL